ncbi:MAG: SIMPL domain-containing protein [Flavobacterium sp.]
MKKFLFATLLISIISCQNTSNSGSSNFKTIMIESVGEVEVLPDMATFYIDLSCLDKSINVSKKCLVDKSNEIHAKLQSFGIDKKDILTEAVNMEKSYNWDTGKNVFEGYKCSTGINVTVRNIDKLAEIYTELLENSNLELRSLNYTHSKMDSLKNEAYVKALEKAGTLADKLLEKLPETEKEVLKMGNVQFEASSSSEIPLPPAIKSAEFDMNRFVNLGNGIVKVYATLYVEYQIK